ncbi:MAG: O-antigen ligase family protein [Pseudomonadota bacterium]
MSGVITYSGGAGDGSPVRAWTGGASRLGQRPRRAPRLRAALPEAQSKSLVHVLCLVCVWLTIASSGVVFAEPAPVDVLSCGLLLLLPAVGLIVITRSLLAMLSVWLIIAALSYLAVGFAPDIKTTTIFTMVSLYLYLAMFIFAAFVARSPVSHTELILSAWRFAAVVAAAAGIIGYLGLLPGAEAAFTKFGRAAGTFKDPNVFGPFLVVPVLYALHQVLARPLRQALVPLAVAGILTLAILLSFSRGAWLNLIIALAVFAYLSFVTAPTAGHRARIVTLLMAGMVTLCMVVVIALQDDRIASLLSQRATLTQSYDVGPYGRFGGQGKAVDLILDNPLGIGALVFGTVHHNEGVHNVYLNMMLNAGWLGGGLFAIMTVMTFGLGLRHMLRATPTRPLFIVLFSAFLAHALEGLIIDTDHWRHLYLIMGMMWGLMAVTWHQLPDGGGAGADRRSGRVVRPASPTSTGSRSASAARVATSVAATGGTIGRSRRAPRLV